MLAISTLEQLIEAGEIDPRSISIRAFPQWLIDAMDVDEAGKPNQLAQMVANRVWEIQLRARSCKSFFGTLDELTVKGFLGTVALERCRRKGSLDYDDPPDPFDVIQRIEIFEEGEKKKEQPLMRWRISRNPCDRK